MKQWHVAGGIMAVALSMGGAASGLAAESRVPETIGDKTIVAWVSPANLEQQGGGIVSLMNGATVVDGKLRLDGRAAYLLVAAPPAVHVGFFTPARKGQIWDTWMYYHEGKYDMYYLAGPVGRWDGHALATSEDGVHWQEYGDMVKPHAGVTWISTGHIWKAPDFDRTHTWVMNYSEWFGDKQDIMFVTSTNLLSWTKVDEQHRFVQDTRWYNAKGRWDCIDAIQRSDGSLYGYFTADPAEGKVAYRPCGFGFAESKDGVAWTALPPVEGDMNGEFGGIQKIGEAGAFEKIRVWQSN